MLRNGPTGELITPRSVRSLDLVEMRAWGGERTIRAAVIRYLLTGDQGPIDAKGVRLQGLRISGDLSSTCLNLWVSLLSLDSCYLDADRPVDMDRATLPYLALTNCHLAGLQGRMLSSHEIDLGGSTLTGPLLLSGAEIVGQLNCCGLQLVGTDENGNALVAFGAKIGGDILLHQGFSAAGAVHLSGANITGQLNCRGARLNGRNDDGYALFADGMKTGGHVLLDANFVAEAAVRLAGADIGGHADATACQQCGRRIDNVGDDAGLSHNEFGVGSAGVPVRCRKSRPPTLRSSAVVEACGSGSPNHSSPARCGARVSHTPNADRERPNTRIKAEFVMRLV